MEGSCVCACTCLRVGRPCVHACARVSACSCDLITCKPLLPEPAAGPGLRTRAGQTGVSGGRAERTPPGATTGKILRLTLPRGAQTQLSTEAGLSWKPERPGIAESTLGAR